MDRFLEASCRWYSYFTLSIYFSVLVYDQSLKRVHEYRTYTGDDCIKDFLEYLKSLEPRLLKEIDSIKPAVMTEQDKVDFEARTTCYACGENFDQSNLFLDHCHATGEKNKKRVYVGCFKCYIFKGQYRGPSCRSCNRKMYERKSFKVWFHNLEGFDSHLIASGN